MKTLILLCIIIFMIILIFYGSSLPNYLSNLFYDNDDNIEGYSGYLTSTTLSPYSSKSIYNLYDNLYYDQNNGNLIVFYDTSTTDSNIYIFNRTNTKTTPSYTTYSARDSSGNLVSNDTTESTISKISLDASTSWVYKTTDSKYEITYIPFGAETYIHVMLTGSTPSMIMSVYFKDPATGGTYDYHLWTTSSNTKTVGTSLDVISGTYSGCSETGCSGDGSNVVDSYYDSSNTLYQISKYIKYNTTNGDLVVESTDTSGNKIITVYARSGNSTIYTSSSNASTLGGKTPNSSISTFSTNASIPFMVTDSLGMNIAVYWAVFDKTVITLYKRTLDSSSTGVDLLNTVLFSGNSVFAASKKVALPPPPTSAPTGISGEIPFNDQTLANYFKWFYYWNKMGGDINNYQNSDKYIEKTQIVPPVCPAQNCPSCNCGGTGTCSTCTSTNPGSGAGATAGASTTSGGIISNTISGTGNLVSDSVRNTAEFGKESIQGTASFGKKAIENTASFGKEAVVGTASAAKSGIEYVGTGVGNFLGRLTNTNGASTTGGVGGNTSYNSSAATRGGGVSSPATSGTYSPDAYSYAGSVNSQYSGNRPEPLPVIADFSKFGR